MREMSKKSICFVLMALMMVGNALPLWADSAERSRELRHVPAQRYSPTSRISSSMAFEVEAPLDDCDREARDAAEAATTAADIAKLAIAAQVIAAIAAIQAQVAIVNANTTLTPAERTAALELLDLLAEAIDNAGELALQAVDAALLVTLALIELRRLACKLLQSLSGPPQ